MRSIRVFALLAVLAACSEPVRTDPPGSSENDVGQVVVQLAHNRSDDSQQVQARALFVRWRGMEGAQLGALLALPGMGVRDLQPGQCQLDDQAIALNEAAQGRSDIQLLDAGSIVVRAQDETLRLEPERYPDLLPTLSGFHYGTIRQLPPDPIGEIEVVGSGGEEIGDFRARIQVPRSVALGLAAESESHGPLVIRRGTDLAIPLAGKEDVYMELLARSADGPIALRCRPLGGAVTIPGRMTLDLQPSKATLAAVHFAHAPLRARAGSSPGDLWVELREELAASLE